METTTNEQKISAPFIQIKYAKCTERIPGLLVSVAGLITSIWANCMCIAVCLETYSFTHESRDSRISESVIFSIQLTHLIVTLTATAGLIIGLKENNRSLLSPWLGTKIIESLMLIIGVILICTGYSLGGYILIMMGIIFFLIGGYICLCVWDTYEKMGIEEKQCPLEDISSDACEDMPINPPSYDSHT